MASSESGPPNWNSTTPIRVRTLEFGPVNPDQPLGNVGNGEFCPVKQSLPNRLAPKKLSYTYLRENGKKFRRWCCPRLSATPPSWRLWTNWKSVLRSTGLTNPDIQGTPTCKSALRWQAVGIPRMFHVKQSEMGAFGHAKRDPIPKGSRNGAFSAIFERQPGVPSAGEFAPTM